MLLRKSALLLIPIALSACQADKAASVPDPTALPAITYSYTNAMTTSEGHMKIDPDGRIQLVERVGTLEPRITAADTFLTEEEQQRFLTVFKGWHKMEPVQPMSMGVVFTISFDGYKVEATDSDRCDPLVRNAKQVLDRLAGVAMRDGQIPLASTRPAETPAPVEYILSTDIDYQFQYDMGEQEVRRRITVSREEGLLKLQEKTTGKATEQSPLPAPVDVKIHLTKGQLETLLSALRRMPDGDQRYPGIDKGPYFSVRYDNRTIISGGLPDTPNAVKNIQVLLENYAQDAKRFPEED